MPPRPRSAGVTITDPLVLYRSLVATKRIESDPAQHRLAIRLQKLYDELKDYEPIVQYRERLEHITRALGTTTGSQASKPAHQQPDLSRNHGATDNGQSKGLLQSLFDRKKKSDGLELTRVLTSHEEVLELDSPRGLMLHGEVGTGKSMMIDLFADCLPNRKKRRWHFTTFMLETFAKLEQLRRTRQIVIPSSLGQQEDYSLLWLAREMIATSPIVFLDEFQLPDRAASKIMTNLMTAFFHLGGVLIATSNRMPEELAKAAGLEFAPATSRMGSLGWKLGLGRSSPGKRSSGAPPGSGDFAAFLEILKARCEVWEMENGQDYRRRESKINVKEAVDHDTAHHLSTQGFKGLDNMSPGNIGLGYEQSKPVQAEGERTSDDSAAVALPKYYFVRPYDVDESADSEQFNKAVRAAQQMAVGRTLSSEESSIPWEASSLRVYGRTVIVPLQHNGATCWTFAELCASTRGPADYITLASNYHTLILTDVPVLSLLQKNEARRLINLLDALYEARCKLIVTAAAGPDDIFFPQAKTRSIDPSESQDEVVDQDAILPETLSEIYQDATAPFRPNVSVYEASTAATPSEPDFTHSRLAGLFSDDQLEDGPPNKPRHRHHSNDMGRGDSIHGLDPSIESLQDRLAAQSRPGPDFSQAGIFTGEDEKFAYKRARSRLWEMCSARWWERDEEDWWRPLDPAVRTWERPASEAAQDSAFASSSASVTGVGEKEGAAEGREGMGGSRDVDEAQDEALFRYGGSPFRNPARPPPKFQWTHFWGMMKWGKKAGAWGKGVDGLEEGMKERQRRKDEDADEDKRGRQS